MIPIRDLFESHLTVSDLRRSMAFYGDTLGLELAALFQEWHAALYWISGGGRFMLGLWEVGSGPQHLRLHLAFTVDLPDLLAAPAHLETARVIPLDFSENPTTEPVVLAWMPPPPRSTSTTPTATVSNSSPCSPIRRSRNKGSYGGAAGLLVGSRAEQHWG